MCSSSWILLMDKIYTYGSVLKSKFGHQRIREDGHYRENPSNHELLTLRGVDCQVLLKMFGGQITLYCIPDIGPPFLRVILPTESPVITIWDSRNKVLTRPLIIYVFSISTVIKIVFKNKYLMYRYTKMSINKQHNK